MKEPEAKKQTLVCRTLLGVCVGVWVQLNKIKTFLDVSFVLVYSMHSCTPSLPGRILANSP